MLCLFLISCTSNTILEEPDDLIPQDKMEDILVDMFIGAIGDKVPNMFDEKNNKCFNVIYRKYQIDSTQFKKSNFYYTSQIDAYDVILKNVKKKLEHKRDSVRQIIKVNDSIRATLSAKKAKIGRDKDQLKSYKALLKLADSLQIDITEKQGLLRVTTPKVSEQNEWHRWSNYRVLDTVKWQSEVNSKENEMAVLGLLKKGLKDKNTIFEVEKMSKTHKDSVLYMKRLLQLDTILYFPLSKKNDLDLKASKYINVLSKMKSSFNDKVTFLKKDIKVQDSLYKKIKEDVDKIPTALKSLDLEMGGM